MLNHGNIIEQKWHVRKSLVICATQLEGGILLNTLNYHAKRFLRSPAYQKL